MPWAIKRHPCPVSATKRRISNRRRLDVKKVESILSQCVDIGGALPRTYTRATSRYNDVLNAVDRVGQATRPAQRLLPRLRRIADRMVGSRTNLIAAGTSERFNVGWSPVDITVTARNTTAPSGELLAADLITEGSAGTATIAENVTITAANFVSVSCYFKVSSVATWIFFKASSDAGVNGYRAWFNISTGVVGAITAFGTGTGTSLSIENAGGGWYRCVSIGKVDAAATVVAINIQSASANSGTTRVNAAAYFAWGACVEQTPFPSSLISNRDLLLQTEVFGTTWAVTDITVTSNTSADPLTGNTTADLCTEGSAGTAVISQDATTVASAISTYSLYLKRGNTDWVRIEILNTAVTNGCRLWVNLSTGAIGTSVAVGTGTLTGSAISSLGGGWYRVSITGTPGAVTTYRVRMTSAAADNSTTRVNGATYTVFGAQLEYGTAPTAYWANTTAVGLRAADSLTVSLASLSEAGLSVTAGTLIAIVRPKDWGGDQDGATAWTVWRMNDAQPSRAARNGATTLFVGRGDAGGAETATVTHALTNGAIGIIAMAYDAASVRGYVGGVAGGTDATLTPPYDSGANVIIVGSAASGTQSFYGDVILLYKDGAISAADLLNIATDIAAVAA